MAKKLKNVYIEHVDDPPATEQLEDFRVSFEAAKRAEWMVIEECSQRYATKEDLCHAWNFAEIAEQIRGVEGDLELHISPGDEDKFNEILARVLENALSTRVTLEPTGRRWTAQFDGSYREKCDSEHGLQWEVSLGAAIVRIGCLCFFQVISDSSKFKLIYCNYRELHEVGTYATVAEAMDKAEELFLQIANGESI